MVFTQTKILDFMLVTPRRVQKVGGANETAIWAKAVGRGHLCTLDTSSWNMRVTDEA